MTVGQAGPAKKYPETILNYQWLLGSLIHFQPCHLRSLIQYTVHGLCSWARAQPHNNYKGIGVLSSIAPGHLRHNPTREVRSLLMLWASSSQQGGGLWHCKTPPSVTGTTIWWDDTGRNSQSPVTFSITVKTWDKEAISYWMRLPANDRLAVRDRGWWKAFWSLARCV